MRTSPQVRCRACDFEWYGATAADGLRIVGSCTRCGGELEFLTEQPSESPAMSDQLVGVAPAAVLGAPTSWAR